VLDSSWQQRQPAPDPGLLLVQTCVQFRLIQRSVRPIDPQRRRLHITHETPFASHREIAISDTRQFTTLRSLSHSIPIISARIPLHRRPPPRSKPISAERDRAFQTRRFAQTILRVPDSRPPKVCVSAAIDRRMPATLAFVWLSFVHSGCGSLALSANGRF
jgi:hypothetical protein